MANSETLAHILEEIRSDEAAKVMATGLLWQDMSFQFNSWADRLEAACKRERIQRDKVSFRCGDCARFGDDCDAGDSDGNEDRVACEKFVRRALVPGNAASMRAALEYVKEKMGSWWEYLEVAPKVEAALAAPPRNCDRFKAADEARMAFWDTHETIWDAFKNRGGTELFYEVLDWLFAPAESSNKKEGGAK